MTTTLILDVTGTTGWLAHERAGQPWRRGDTVPAQARIIVLAPAESVTWHRVHVPARNLSELRQAVPFALEERLAEPVETLHFALGAREAGWVEVAVVARSLLRTWLEDARSAASAMPDQAFVDAQLLPRSTDAIHLARVEERVLLAFDDLATALPAADWPQWHERLPSLPQRWLGRDGRFDDTESPPVLDRAALLRFASTRVARISAPDLLQGGFAAHRKTASRQRQWRWAAALAGLAVLLALTEAGVGVWTEQKRRNALNAQIATVFRQALPDHRMTADPAAQFASELSRQRRGSSAGGPFPLLGAAAPLLTRGSQYRLEAVDYRLGMLEIEVQAGDVASLDSLREGLTASGVSAEVTGVNPQDSGVRGRLRLRGSGT